VSEHARLAPSKAKRWLNCPGSVLATDGIADESSKYADEGTAAHNVMEHCLTAGVNAAGFLGITVKPKFKVTQEMVDAVQSCVDYVRERKLPQSEMWVERRDGLEAVKSLPEPIFGTTDVCLWNPESKVLEILDLKYGRGVVVEAEENEQLLIYALAQVIRIGVAPAKIILHIMQPRAHHEDGPFRSWETNIEYLGAFKKKIVAAAVAAQDSNAPLAVGEWCRFCPAIATCPAQMKMAVRVAQEEFEIDPPYPGDLPDAHEMGTERISFVLKHADAVENWFAAVREHAKNLLNAGQEVPGFKLVRGRSNRRWKDEVAAEKMLQKAGLKAGVRRVVKVISPAQAEKALKKISKELNPAMIEKPEGALTVVPVADARPAVIGAQEEFGALPDSTD
jgi:hypothetical protein